LKMISLGRGASGVRFEVIRPNVEELPRPGEAPDVLVLRLAHEQASEVLTRVGHGRSVLAADTVVAIGDQVLGKPLDPADAARMLRMLAGRTHQVYTGCALGRAGDPAVHTSVECSQVTLCALSDAQIAAYVASGEPLDKAGAYAAQGEAGRFVKHIEGLRSNVIGLPVESLLPRLRELGVVES